MINWIGGTGNDNNNGSGGADRQIGDSDVFTNLKGTYDKKGKFKVSEVEVGLGNDRINGGGGDDIITGDLEFKPDGFIKEIYHGGKGKEPIPVNVVNRGSDTIDGGAGADTIFGGVGNDKINVSNVGDGYGDVVNGGSGSAVFRIFSGKKGKTSFVEDVLIDDDNDTLDLSGSTDSDVKVRVVYSNTEDGRVEWFMKSTGSIVGTLDFEDIENVIVPCLVKGTMVSTLKGSCAVEDLKAGDLVWTADHGFKPILWAGSRTAEGQGDFAPIRIKEGTLGNTCDLLVSPQHRVIIENAENVLYFDSEEVLVPAKFIINGTSIVVDKCEEVEYFHILFDMHEIIRANGALVESFYPGQMGIGGFEENAREELLELFPDLFDTDSHEIFGPAARPFVKRQEAPLLGKEFH